MRTHKFHQGELEHRRVKRFYARTNKVRFIPQIIRLESRERALQRRRLNLENALERLERRREAKRRKTSKRPVTVTVGFEEAEALAATPPEVHHHLSHSRNFPVSLAQFVPREDNEELPDVAEKVPLFQYCDMPYLTYVSRTF